MICKAIYWSFLVATVSSFLLDDISTTSTSATLSIKELTIMLLDERALSYSLTQRIMSLETAVTTLYHTVEKLTLPTHSQTTSTDTENKILKLENGFNSSINNISTAVDNLIHTQLNVNNMMAYFDRNMNNISLTVINILQHQNNISTCVDTENKILKLETEFKSSINNVSTLIENIAHTQLNATKMMAYVDRNMNNISSSVENLRLTQHQLIISQHAYNNIQDGRWSGWGSWGSCSATCNGGMRSRHRSCNNPTPSLLGKSCIGNIMDTDICNNKNCPSPMVYFTVQAPDRSLTTYSRPLFTRVVSNQGGAYNMKTAVFTAPVTGLYHFSILFSLESHSDVYCALFHNNNYITSPYTGTTNHFAPSAVYVYVYLDLGDTVDIRNCHNWQNVVTSSNSIFTGTLVLPS